MGNEVNLENKLDRVFNGTKTIKNFDEYTEVEISTSDKNEQGFLEKYMYAMGFVPTKSGKEMASQGILQFTNNEYDINTYEMEFSSSLNEEDYNDENFEEDLEEATELKAEDSLSIHPLKVVRDPDIKKMADKIYSGLLGATDDYETYAQFLIEFDLFLRNHSPRIVAETDKKMKEIKSYYNNDEGNSTNNGPENDGNTYEESASYKELASLVFSDKDYYSYITNLLVEVAKKKKSSRSQVLSSLMKSMSSYDGEQVIKAWENGDAEALTSSFSKVAKSIAEDIPEENKKKEEKPDDSPKDNNDDNSNNNAEHKDEDKKKEEKPDITNDEPL